jgi:sugar lactone lactonase YvrE
MRASIWATALALTFTATSAFAQLGPSESYQTTYGWEQLPSGKTLGVASGVFPDRDGKHIWILARCGGNNCAGSDADPIMQFDMNGKLIKSFGKGHRAFPHGFFLDTEGNVWVTEGAPVGDRRGDAGFKIGKGHQVFKFAPDGKLLMTLGTAGVAGDDATHFNGPSGVAIAPNGDIWVVDGHRGGNNRVVRFSKDGKFLKSIGGGVGSESADKGRFSDPHGIAIDSRGRIYVADRGNNRIQILDGEGNFLEEWKQFGKPSGVYIDANDTIYVGDGMSTPERNPGVKPGIRVGDAKTGRVTAFIPDNEKYGAGESGVEFLAADAQGNIYAGEVTRQRLGKHIPLKP